MEKISFQCPNCHKELSAPDGMAGKIAPCPGCQVPVKVPEPSLVAASGTRNGVATPSPPVMMARVVPEPPPPPPDVTATRVLSAPPQRRVWAAVLIGLGLAALVGGLFIAGAVFLSNQLADSPDDNNFARTQRWTVLTVAKLNKLTSAQSNALTTRQHKEVAKAAFVPLIGQTVHWDLSVASKTESHVLVKPDFFGLVLRQADPPPGAWDQLVMGALFDKYQVALEIGRDISREEAEGLHVGERLATVATVETMEIEYVSAGAPELGPTMTHVIMVTLRKARSAETGNAKVADDAHQPGKAVASTLVDTRGIVGTWHEVFGSERLQFMDDGTIHVLFDLSPLVLSGRYTETGDDEYTFLFDGLQGERFGKVTCTLNSAHTELVSRYEISTAEDIYVPEGSIAAAINPQDLRQTWQWVYEAMRALSRLAQQGNQLAVDEVGQQVSAKLDVLVGQQIVWQATVNAISSDAVLFKGDLGFLQIQGPPDEVTVQEGPFCTRVDAGIPRQQAIQLRKNDLVRISATVEKVTVEDRVVYITLRGIRALP